MVSLESSKLESAAAARPARLVAVDKPDAATARCLDRAAASEAAAPRSKTACTVGVLALQGDFAEAHARLLTALGADAQGEVRTPAELEGLDALIIPGGESTVMTLGSSAEGLARPLQAFAASGTPVLGTCAGMIMLDRDHLGVLDIAAQRNAFGRQLRSFEADLEFDGISGGAVHAVVFIRAPWVAEYADDVEVLARVDGHPVAVRQGNVSAVAFHPELSGETRLHALLLGLDRP